jgi:hypothetical protein
MKRGSALATLRHNRSKLMLLFGLALAPQVSGVCPLVGLYILEAPLLVADSVKLRAFGATVSCPLRHVVCLSPLI